MKAGRGHVGSAWGMWEREFGVPRGSGGVIWEYLRGVKGRGYRFLRGVGGRLRGAYDRDALFTCIKLSRNE